MKAWVFTRPGCADVLGDMLDLPTPSDISRGREKVVKDNNWFPISEDKDVSGRRCVRLELKVTGVSFLVQVGMQ